jgi:serine/threonine protein kinase
MVKVLQYLGSHGLFHGDLKSPNLLLQPGEGEALTAVVSDLSSLRPVDESGAVPACR